MGRNRGWDDDEWGTDDDEFGEKEARMQRRQNNRRKKLGDQEAAFDPVVDEE